MYVYEGVKGVGLVLLLYDLMYMYLIMFEFGNLCYLCDMLVVMMCVNFVDMLLVILGLVEQIIDDDVVVYKLFEWLLIEGDWYQGWIVLLGDVVYVMMLYLGQGVGMVIEDLIVFVEEFDCVEMFEVGFCVYCDCWFDCCVYIVCESLVICMGQIGKGFFVNVGKVIVEMFVVIVKLI